jgi:2',3'-cyclic-nucleotide 2'-phosphodiesterase
MSRAACRSGKASKQARDTHLFTGFRAQQRTAKWTAAPNLTTARASANLNIFFIGDIVGSPGRKIVHERLADILAQRQVDLCIANGENSASGFGITPRIVQELLATGIEVLTGGNHIWDRREIMEFFPHEPRLLRPANFPDGAPGSGLYIGRAKNGVPYAVVNVQGRTFMTQIDDPFRIVLSELAKIPADVKVIFVDMHAEATSEKIAMGWHLDGKVSVVVGTHTHVPTADAHVLPAGTAYITDVGMTGPHDSIIGMDKRGALQRFRDALPARFVVAENDIQMNTVLVDVDESTGRARSIERLTFRLD